MFDNYKDIIYSLFCRFGMKKTALIISLKNLFSVNLQHKNTKMNTIALLFHSYDIVGIGIYQKYLIFSKFPKKFT